MSPNLLFDLSAKAVRRSVVHVLRRRLTHAGVLFGSIRDDLHVVAVHVVAEEIVQVRLGPLAAEYVQAPVSLREGQTGRG